MATKTKKSIFYHIPKTGGTFVRDALRYSLTNKEDYGRVVLDYEPSKEDYWRLKLAHTLHLQRTHETPWGVKREEKAGLFSFAFVRHPLEWYKSFWSFRKDAYDANAFVNDSAISFTWDVDFDKYIDNVVHMFPHGYVSVLYQAYLGKNGEELNFVGKQEQLREDLIKALSLAGEDFDPDKIMRLKQTNVSKTKLKSNSLELNKNQRRSLLKREKWVLETFYK